MEGPHFCEFSWLIVGWIFDIAVYHYDSLWVGIPHFTGSLGSFCDKYSILHWYLGDPLLGGCSIFHWVFMAHLGVNILYCSILSDLMRKEWSIVI